MNAAVVHRFGSRRLTRGRFQATGTPVAKVGAPQTPRDPRPWYAWTVTDARPRSASGQQLWHGGHQLRCTQQGGRSARQDRYPILPGRQSRHPRLADRDRFVTMPGARTLRPTPPAARVPGQRLSVPGSLTTHTPGHRGDEMHRLMIANWVLIRTKPDEAHLPRLQRHHASGPRSAPRNAALSGAGRRRVRR